MMVAVILGPLGASQPTATVERVQQHEYEMERAHELAESWAQARVAEREQVTKTLPMVATSYTAYCTTGCIGITKTGLDVSNTIYHEGRRIIAADPSVIPLGSHVTILLQNGGNIDAIVEDTGGDIVGNRIDILAETREQALEFGRQAVEIIINE